MAKITLCDKTKHCCCCFLSTNKHPLIKRSLLWPKYELSTSPWVSQPIPSPPLFLFGWVLRQSRLIVYHSPFCTIVKKKKLTLVLTTSLQYNKPVCIVGPGICKMQLGMYNCIGHLKCATQRCWQGNIYNISKTNYNLAKIQQ